MFILYTCIAGIKEDIIPIKIDKPNSQYSSFKILKKVLVSESGVNRVIPDLKGNDEVNKLPKEVPVTSAELIVCVKEIPFFINLLILGIKEDFLESKILS